MLSKYSMTILRLQLYSFLLNNNIDVGKCCVNIFVFPCFPDYYEM